MSKPKVLAALTDLDNAGFYDRSTYLGDIRSSPNCLDTVVNNGIYVFTGGKNTPTDSEGNYKWSLRVYACEDCTNVEHLAERIVVSDSRIIFIRSLSDNSWSSWISGYTEPEEPDPIRVVVKTLVSTDWVFDDATGWYSQTVQVDNLASNNKVDLDADKDTIKLLSEFSASLFPANEDGVLKVYSDNLIEADVNVQLTISPVTKDT